jgi:hypothetical protein
MDTAQWASDRVVEDFFFLSFFGGKGLESGYDFVAAGHDAVHLRLGQIAFGFSVSPSAFSSFQFFEQLAVAFPQIFRPAQVLARAEGAAESDASDGPVFTKEHVGEVGIGVADKLGGYSSGCIVCMRRVRHYAQVLPFPVRFQLREIIFLNEPQGIAAEEQPKR